MPISINGSGTITGVSVGGLPDGIVDTDMLAADAVSAAKLAAGAGGKFESVAVVCDQKGAADGGGTFTSGGHVQRDLNTEIFDPDGIVSVASNQFTIAAGNYLIIWRAPAFRVNTHVSRLRDMTADPNVSYEGAATFADSNSGQTDSWGFARVTPTVSTTYQIRHRCEATKTGNGLGISSNSYAANSIHTTVWIFKEV